MSHRTAVGPRLAPDERRRHLVDIARSIVTDEGIAPLTMEHVAERAGVSRGLVYNYFGNRAGLVTELWASVAVEWGGDPMPAIPLDASDDDLHALFADRLATTTSWYFDRIERGGELLLRLLSDPDLGDEVAAFRHHLHDLNVAWWAQLCERLGVPEAEATVFSTMFNGASEGLWELVASDTVPRAVIERVFLDSARVTFDDLLARSRRS